jgi:hypothetical protein
MICSTGTLACAGSENVATPIRALETYKPAQARVPVLLDTSTFRVIRRYEFMVAKLASPGKWKAEATILLRRVLILALLLGVLILGWLSWRGAKSRQQPQETPAPVVIKQQVNFANRTFDPANPPSDMPPLPPGENAECDSDFTSNASVSGQVRRTDATHATLTITKIKVALQLNLTIWVPAGVTQHVMEHEDGHRQISEHYYQTADKLAEGIASPYMGKQVEVSGADLNTESNKTLEQMASEITAEYNRELNTEPAQLLYDSITDHSRNEVVANDAVAHTLKNVSIESPRPQ